jgi:deoxyribodipyrimidine photo-lyase
MQDKQPINIVWLKKDLRISDHAALSISTSQDIATICIFVFEKKVMKYLDYSHFHHEWIIWSLHILRQDLKKLNIPLIVVWWEVLEIFDKVRLFFDIKNIYAHEETGNQVTFDRDISVIKYCKTNHIPFTEFPTNGVVRRLKSRDELRAIRMARMWDKIYSDPISQSPIVFDKDFIEYIRQIVVDVYPTQNDGRRAGEVYAHKYLNRFLGWECRYYIYSLSRPALARQGNSRLSTYLTYGNISLRQVYQATKNTMASLRDKSKQTQSESDAKKIFDMQKWLNAFSSRLSWRCHFVQRLESQPNIEFQNINSAFDTIRQIANPEYIYKFEHGQTGIPFIDACMRCLKATGWINFRARATITSFACNTLMQPWQPIAHILARYFIDYEPWLHYSQIQMQSGTTWFNTLRIYNPTKQLLEKDKDFEFINKRVPELSKLPDSIKPEPRKANWLYGFDLEQHYFMPIVDVEIANRIARDALRSVKKSQESKSKIVWLLHKHWSRKSKPLSPRKSKSTKSKYQETGSLFE